MNSEIEKLKHFFSILKFRGHEVFIKNHPRQKANGDMFKGIKIVEETVDLYTIFSDFEYIVAQYSTVLLQAWYWGAKVVVDDLSNVKLTDGLADREYFFSKRKANMSLLSEFLETL